MRLLDDRIGPTLGGQIKAAAVQIYELRQLPSGAAAQLAGAPRAVFLRKLADYGVNTFKLTESELREEFMNAEFQR
jgi:hypothetical protein